MVHTNDFYDSLKYPVSRRIFVDIGADTCPAELGYTLPLQTV